MLADAAAFADLHGHGARDHVTGGEVLGVRGIALHEALALGVGQIAALAACALGDQAACAVNAGGVELDEFHVLQRQTRAQHHGVAVARAGVRGGGGEIGAAIAAGRQNGLLGAEAVQGAVVEFPGGDASAGAVLIHDQVEHEILDEELGRMAQGLAVQRMQDGVTGAVGGGAGALHRAFAEIAGHAAKGALIDLAIFRPGERHAPVLKLVHGFRRVAAEIFDGVLVAQPVRPLHGVVHVPAPVILAHIAQRGGNAALGCDGVRAGGENLRDAGRLQAFLGGAQGGAEAGAACAHDNNVKGMVGPFICGHSSRPSQLAIASTAYRAATHRPAQISVFAISSRALDIGLWM